MIVRTATMDAWRPNMTLGRSKVILENIATQWRRGIVEYGAARTLILRVFRAGALLVLLVVITLQASGQTSLEQEETPLNPRGGTSQEQCETVVRSIGETGQLPDKTAAEPYDLSDWFTVLAAVEAAGGWDSDTPRGPTAYAGAKLGFAVDTGKIDSAKTRVYTATLDLGYDRVQARSGFTTEASVMLPVFRFPKPQVDESKNFVRVYFEPGAGYKSGGGAFGGYASAKVMIAFFSDKRLGRSKPSPFIEIQPSLPVCLAPSG